MVDTLSPAERSKRMSLIRSSDTGPEMLVRRSLHSKGFRFRLHRRDLPGTPDIVLPKYRVAILVNGCFWHAHHCQKRRIPGTRSEFWAEKLAKNRKRDARNKRLLKKGGWRVITVWECELSTAYRAQRRWKKLMREILIEGGRN